MNRAPSPHRRIQDMGRSSTGSPRVHVIGARAETSGYVRLSHARRLFRVR
jgi:hypothetical protein